MKHYERRDKVQCAVPIITIELAETYLLLSVALFLFSRGIPAEPADGPGFCATEW